MKRAKNVMISLLGVSITDRFRGKGRSLTKTPGLAVHQFDLKLALAEIGKSATDIWMQACADSDASDLVHSLITLRVDSLLDFAKVTTEVKPSDQRRLGHTTEASVAEIRRSSDVILQAVRKAPDHLMSNTFAIAENSRRASGHTDSYTPKRSLSDGEVFLLSENPSVWLGESKFFSDANESEDDDGNPSRSIAVMHGSVYHVLLWPHCRGLTQLVERYRANFPKVEAQL